MEINWFFLLLAAVPVWMVIGNALVMLAVLRHRNLQNLLNTVIASLALTDFLLAVFVVPCSILQLMCGRWILGFHACLVWTGSDVILSTSSIMHLCAIAIHRYRGIAYPLHTRSASGRHVAALVIPAWMIAVALSVPFIVQATLHQSYVLQAVADDSLPPHLSPPLPPPLLPPPLPPPAPAPPLPLPLLHHYYSTRRSAQHRHRHQRSPSDGFPVTNEEVSSASSSSFYDDVTRDVFFFHSSRHLVSPVERWKEEIEKEEEEEVEEEEEKDEENSNETFGFFLEYGEDRGHEDQQQQHQQHQQQQNPPVRSTTDADRLGEGAMHCGIFNRVFTVYSSLVSFFIPLAVMILADIGSIRTLRKNASLKLKSPCGPAAGSPPAAVDRAPNDRAVSNNFLRPRPTSVDRASNDNPSSSTLTSPLTPTFRGQTSGLGRGQGQGLFFTEASNLPLGVVAAAASGEKAEAKRSRCKIFKREFKMAPRRNKMRAIIGRVSGSSMNDFFSIRGRKTDDFPPSSSPVAVVGGSDQRVIGPDRQSRVQSSETGRISPGHSRRSYRLKVFRSARRTKKRRTEPKTNGGGSGRCDDDDFRSAVAGPETPDGSAAAGGGRFRPRTRSLVRLEILYSRSSRVSGRERRAEKTLIWVFLLFVGLWLPFFCTNLAYGICGGDNGDGDDGDHATQKDADVVEGSTGNESFLAVAAAATSTSSPPPIGSVVDGTSLCHIPSELFTVFTWLGYLSSGVNPCIYTLLNKDFRRAFRNTLTCSRARMKRRRNRMRSRTSTGRIRAGGEMGHPGGSAPASRSQPSHAGVLESDALD